MAQKELFPAKQSDTNVQICQKYAGIWSETGKYQMSGAFLSCLEKFLKNWFLTLGCDPRRCVLLGPEMCKVEQL